MIGISRKRKRPAVREDVKQNSRRNALLDPHAGGFSFFDVPQNEQSATTKHKEIAGDISLQRAARGLSNIFGVDGSLNVEAVEAEKGDVGDVGHGVDVPVHDGHDGEDMAKSVSVGSSTGEREDSVKSIDLDSIFATNGDRAQLAKYRREDIVRAWWRELEPKVRAEPQIKFNELIATHAVALNIDLDEEVIADLKNEYNQTIVDIVQSSPSELVRTVNAKMPTIGIGGVRSAPQSVWAQLVENLQSPYKSQNVQALEFVLSVLEEEIEESDSENDDDQKEKIPKNVESASERRAKCLSILTQNSDALGTILNSDRAHFVDQFTRILCAVIPDDKSDDHSKGYASSFMICHVVTSKVVYIL